MTRNARVDINVPQVRLMVAALLAERLNPVDEVIGWTTDTDPRGW